MNEPPPLSHCLNCGYALRGLSTSAVCPECGHALPDPATRASTGELPIDVMQRVRRGAAWYGSGFVTCPWIVLLLFVLPAVTPAMANSDVGMTLLTLLMLAPLLVMQIGWWMIATPSAPGDDPYWPGARPLRVATVIVTVIMTASAALHLLWHVTTGVIAPRAILALVVLYATALAIRLPIAAGTIARLARSMHDAKLDRHARMLPVQLGIMLGLGALSGVLATTLAAPTVLIALVCGTVFSGILLLGGLLFTVTQLRRLIERRLDRLRPGSLSFAMPRKRT